ncbi:efflux RND transporter permease subunit [Caulobacter sp. RL271]|jgi:HAE1 family hydrophobic/amphiphilic exporter-1|uniref:Efflux RND transporter permease subunit n=1 Tax=Caulobacter segnis TaxID=88688 RepID=A0ABY4ZRK5_9CAUL|nr:efflux RND transporter permease subunit [Caulobacter segnis]USQ95140.1 efflux RND transporter permease subunit [Caulobacter segnis]
MRNISSWAIKNPIPVILLFLLLTIAGIAGFRSMRINNNPDVDLPIVVVTAVRPGAAPSELETQVTRLIEDSIAGLGQVRHTRSTVVDGASTTVIEFELGVDHERVTNDVRNAMSNLRGSLPQDMQEPIVTRVDISGDPLITYVVRAPTMTPEQRSWFVDNDVSRALLAIKGVGEVNRQGGVSREIEVALDPDRLAAQGVTAAAVSQALVSSNADLPGGRVTISGAERAIRTLGAAGSVEQLRETRVPVSSGGGAVRLADLGQITDHWAEPRSRARYDGQEVVTFNMVRSRGASEVQTAEKVRKAVEQLDKEHPELEIREITSNVKYIEESYVASMEALIIGAVLAVLVVLLFLRDWRATLLAAVAIPMSLLPTFAVLAPMNQSLNGVTLLALSLTVGILVDDAIVEIENMVRHMRGGKSPYAAAMEAADEIGLAVVATTFTIVAVFAPVGFMPGIIGQFFKAFALAACISVLFSLVVARLLTPLMGAYMLKADAKHEDKDPPWMGPYLKSLNWGLNNRWKVLAMGIPMFVISIFLATRLPFEFQPQADRGRAEFSIELPPGATLDETDAVVQRVTRELMARKEVVGVYASVGGNAVNKGELTADLTDKGQRISQQQFSRQMVDQFAAIPGARIGAGSNNGGGPSSGGSYTLSLLSDNGPALEAAARRVEAEMRGVPGLAHVVNTASIARPEIVVTPKPDQAARAGVSAGAISQAVRVATIGDVDQNLPKYNLGDRQVPIRLRLDQNAREDIAVLQTLQVPSATGSVPLNAVADVRFGAGPSQIDRRDRSRVATITAELDGIVVGEAAKRVHALPSVKNLPNGVKEVAAGDTEFIAEMVSGFLGALITGILLMYVVLVLLFRSFAHPITIMVALPLAIGGAFGLLVLAKSSFSISTLIGILMLMGIAAKNSILLVEYAIMAMKEHGMDKRTAIIDAAHKRARPILMTTVAMGAGMLPTAIGLGAEVEFRAPMAIAVIGGLITSTLLSLLYIPVVFILMDGLKTRSERLMGRIFGGHHHVAAKKSIVE